MVLGGKKLPHPDLKDTTHAGEEGEGTACACLLPAVGENCGGFEQLSNASVTVGRGGREHWCGVRGGRWGRRGGCRPRPRARLVSCVKIVDFLVSGMGSCWRV